MIIGIDGNEANIEKRVGVNQYGYELLRSMYKISGEWKDKHRIVVYLKQKPRKDLPKETNFWQYKVLSGGGLWIIRKLTPALFREKVKPDVFFTPSHYIPPIAPMPRICAVMDLGYLVFSGQFKTYDFWQLKLWSAYSIYVSKRIIAISKSTKKDIVRHYKINPKKVDITHLGYDELRFNLSKSKNDVRRIKKKYSISDNYILFMSTLKPSKNVEGLLEAWSIIESDYQDVSLVVAGKKGWLYDSIFEKVQKLDIEDRVIFTDFLPEEDKEAMIKGAKLFVLPSFWEGFGLDVVSSMASGVPAVVSRAGSLPEVAGDVGIYINPESPRSIANGIEKVLTMKRREYSQLVKDSAAHAKRFSWENTARMTLEVLEKAAGN